MAGGGAEATQVATGIDALTTYLADQDRQLQDLNARVTDLGGRGRTDGAIPLIITTESRALDGEFFLFWSGPKNTTWSFTMRGAEQQTRAGTISHYWRDDKRSTFFDEPTLQFTFQSGNIMPVRYANSSIITLPPGLADYYSFFDILDDKKILSDGRPNFVMIVYSSLAYPNILLRGFFQPEGLQVTESADNPASLEWQSTFKIRSSTPSFNNGLALKRTWQQQASTIQNLNTDAFEDQGGFIPQILGPLTQG